jgi:hypothetical protein
MKFATISDSGGWGDVGMEQRLKIRSVGSTMKVFWATLLACGLFFTCVALREMVVKTTVADLRALDERTNIVGGLSLEDLQQRHEQDPTIYRGAPSIFCKDNPLLLSQLLFGERVFVIPSKGDWYKILAFEQRIFHENAWQSCPGFVHASCLTDQLVSYKTCLVVVTPWALLYKNEQPLRQALRLLSLGTCLSGIKKDGDWWVVNTPIGNGIVADKNVAVIENSIDQEATQLRTAVIATAKLFLGGPYVWGGCCAWKGHAIRQPNSLKDQITGVDCSNLINLSFRAHGFLVPRNSHSQWLVSLPIAAGKLLQAGDLIFWADIQQKPMRVNHVVMYIGKDESGEELILESNGKIPPFGVRTTAVTAYPRLGNKPLAQVHNKQLIRWLCDGKEIKEKIYFGTFFTNDNLAKLRRAFLRIKQGTLRIIPSVSP